MSEAQRPTNVLESLPTIVRTAIPLVREQELHPEDGISVLLVAAWTIDPKRGKDLPKTLGLGSFRSHYDRVANDPVLTHVYGQIARTLRNQLPVNATLKLS